MRLRLSLGSRRGAARLCLIGLAAGLFGLNRGAAAPAGRESPSESIEIVSVKKIWDKAPHSAFTDLIRFQGKWFCTFREAQGHVKGDGRIRILVSSDGDAWESAALLAEEGIDLRDPKISIAADGRLMIVAGGSVYRNGKLVGRQPRVSFSTDGHAWTATQRILSEGEWLWRVTWHEGRAYGVSYNASGGAGEWPLTLFVSRDGIDYDAVGKLKLAGRPNETTLRFTPDGEMIALVRREGGGANGMIGISKPPYTEWTWHETKHRLGGPNFIILPDGTMWAASRSYSGGAKTVVSRFGRQTYEPVLTLPSGGDCSYPGLVWHEGLLWVSYYSSHEGRASIYLATLRVIHTVRSPDGRVNVWFTIKNDGTENGCLFYGIQHKGQDIIHDSRLGLELKNEQALNGDFDVVSVERTSRRTEYTPVYGERKTIRDHYNELDVDLREKSGKKRNLQLTFRAYDEGAAFRYKIPEQDALGEFTISSEKSHFRFPENCMAYEEHGTEGEYRRVSIRDIKPNCERPLTVEYGTAPFVSLTEACVDNYARMLLSPAKGRPGTLVSALSGSVKASPPFSTPWRVFVIGDRPGDLIEHNDLIRNLNLPCAIEDTSWIKPGKVIREVTLSTEGGKACVDFAVEHNLQYVEYDAGWYGHEYDDASDATTVSVDPKRSRAELDLQGVIDYAEQRGIGILVYVNRRALERQLDAILPLYRKWGVKGIKFGFVRVGPQDATNFVHEAVRKAARHNLMVDIHDSYRPTGFSRTYPNLMTQEGVRGNEHMPTAEHNCTLPFTRCVAGAADVTVCYYSDRIKNTRAHQLATAVVFYSPLQFLFWYDRPSAYQREAEIEFFEHVPTVWDDTKVIHGAIGDYVTIARRAGDEWYVGILTDENARTLNVPLRFLDEDKKYTAHIYADTIPPDGSRTNVTIRRCVVGSSTVIRARMAASGGQAMRLVPATAGDPRAYLPYK